LPVLVVVPDVRKGTALRCLLQEVRIASVDENDDGASRFAHDLVDQFQRTL
jgi:hypothetical protein